MYGFMKRIRSYVRAEVRGAVPTRFLNACARSGIRFRKAVPAGDFALRLTLHRRDLQQAQSLASRAQCEFQVLGTGGLPFRLRRIKGRYLLLGGLLLCAGLLAWSSLHIWELEIQGNQRADTAEIYAALDQAGVGIGSFWPALSNDFVKSEVMLRVPELSWLAVNVRGSKAIVQVRERVEPPAVYDEKQPVELVASKAGLITKLGVLQGTAAVEAGDTVLPGELLISGEMVSSFEKAGSRAVHAKGSVFARTWYEDTACAPLQAQVKTAAGRSRLHLALELGDTRINFDNVFNNSGNYHEECDKIIGTHRLALGQVFTTPLALVVERMQPYSLTAVERDEQLLRQQLETELTQQLRQKIGEDGEILGSRFFASEVQGYLYVTLRAECVEDIGLEREFLFEPPAIPEETKGEESQ